MFPDGLDMGFTAHHHAAAAGAVAFAHAGEAVNGGAGGEVGGFDGANERVDRRIWIGQELEAGIHRVAQIVRRYVGGHAHGNTGRTVGQQGGEAGGHHQRLLFAAVVVRAEVYGVFFNVGQYFMGDFRHADFGVTHGCRAVAVYRAEVALAVYQHIAHRKGLCHAHDGVVHRGIAVRMVFTDNVAHDTGGFFIRRVPIVFQLVHSVEHAAVHGFQAVAHIGQRTADDYRHGVIEIAFAHFLFEADGDGFFGKPVVVGAAHGDLKLNRLKRVILSHNQSSRWLP